MKCFIATYINDVNTTSGDVAEYLAAVLLRDEDGNVHHTANYDDMDEICKNEAQNFIDNSEYSELRGYEIIDTENGCAVVDNEGYRIITYDIHDLDIEINLK